MKFLSVSFTFTFLIFYSYCFGTASADTCRIDPWIGTWSGTLEIYNSKGKTQEVPMKVNHFLTDTIGTYGWFLIYGEEETGTRSYFLKTVDEKKGHYIVDEKNSIFLDEFMIGNKMISSFEVEGSLITSIYTLLKDGNMTFEIIFGNNENPTESGDTLNQDEEIPQVYSYMMKGYQKAHLVKEN
jgi:hypothetical protein